MRGPSLSPKEPRHRAAASAAEETSRRGFQRNKVFRDVEKAFHVPLRYRNWNCKISTLKVVLVTILVGSLITLLRSPAVYISDRPSNLVSRPGFVDRWIRDSVAADPRYISMLDVNWDQILNVIEKLTDRDEYQGIGLLNFNNTETDQWKQLLPDAEHVVLQLDYVADNVTWESLFPEWIDEEEEFEVPNCPSLPSLQFPGKPRIDLLAVKLPCNKAGKWSRDVTRLHFQLAAARLAASAKGLHPVHVLFVTDCFPLPNLFTCKDLVAREGSAWLYTPNLHRLREKIRLPVGSCELSVPLQAKGSFYSERAHSEAYATILHSAHVYVCGAITAAQSIRMSGSTRDLVILVDDSISDYHRGGLEAAGWKIYTIQRIRNPKAEPEAYNEWNYSKFRLWQLTDYDKIIFIDADLLILRNIDFLFEMPQISAIGNNATLFNSGVMVVEPSNCTFQLLMDHINEIESYNGGDQGYLNEIFTWWHRIPKHMNFLKHFWEGDEVEKKQMKTRLFGAHPPILYVIHYLGNKPWLCFRDYDCNWNVDILQEFASDVAHKTWWKVHDAMPENLQKYCLLRSKQKAQLEWDRRQAEKGNYTDGHWKIKIKDKRLKTCFEEFCFWESMLWHWGEKNWTDNSTANPSPPAIKKFVTMQLTHCLPTKNLSWTPRVHHRRHSPPTSAVRFAPIFPAVTVSPPKHQKTHSMPPEKQEVFKSMENWATENVLPLLKPVKDCWQPQTFLPDPALPLEEFNDQVKELRERMAELPDDYFVVLVGDMITEEALPTYQTMINTLDGVKDETGASSSPWAVWTRAWTAEENRHGDLLRNYLYLSGRVNMFMIERTLQYLIGAGMDPGTENNPYLGFVYTSFQERATFVSHGNTARLAKEGGDPVLARICGTIAADEKRHEMAYSKIVGKLLEIDPTGAMLAIGDMMKKKITMPAHLMFDGEDPRLFEHFAAVAQRIGVYTSDDYADIVEALNERWGLEKLEGLRDEGRRAQEFVCNLAPRIRKLQERAEERAKKMGPQAVKFSWIFSREIKL